MKHPRNLSLIYSFYTEVSLINLRNRNKYRTIGKSWTVLGY